MNGLINNKGVIIFNNEEHSIHKEYYALCFDYTPNLLNKKMKQRKGSEENNELLQN